MGNQWGAYGFCLIYPDEDETLQDLVEQEPGAPVVTVRWRLASTIVVHERVEERRVSLGAPGASGFFVERDPASIVFDLEQRPVPDALIHPLGTVPLAVLARWRGDLTLHAGGFAVNSHAFAVIGERETGKSTMLAALGERGLPLVADDLLTVADRHVLPGPACVDLRPDAATRFPRARDLGIVGDRPRFRLATPPASGRLPLRGLFVLGWHDAPAVAVEPVPVSELLRLLYGIEYVGLLGPAEPEKILDLMELPAWRVLRPRDWSTTSDAVDAILETAAQARS